MPCPSGLRFNELTHRCDYPFIVACGKSTSPPPLTPLLGKLPMTLTVYDGLYGEAPPERGIFFRLQVYERVGILLVKVCKRVGKSVIWVCEGPKRTSG